VNIRLVSVAFSIGAGFVPFLPAADLSVYRDFHLGMTVAEVAKQTGVPASQARVIAMRPERIEQLGLADRLDSRSAELPASSPPSGILFSFYNNELFAIAISYREKTAGLTESNMVEAISAVYGPVKKQVLGEVTFESGVNTTAKAFARWEDHSRLMLVDLPYASGFGLSLSSSSMKAKAEQAILDSTRLDLADAPRRQAALRDNQSADARAAEENARLSNKPGFRP